MNVLLKFLIYNMKTIDGNKDSGVKLIKYLVSKEVKSQKICPEQDKEQVA